MKPFEAYEGLDHGTYIRQHRTCSARVKKNGTKIKSDTAFDPYKCLEQIKLLFIPYVRTVF